MGEVESLDLCALLCKLLQPQVSDGRTLGEVCVLQTDVVPQGRQALCTHGTQMLQGNP